MSVPGTYKSQKTLEDNKWRTSYMTALYLNSLAVHTEFDFHSMPKFKATELTDCEYSNDCKSKDCVLLNINKSVVIICYDCAVNFLDSYTLTDNPKEPQTY